jgi:hypothetical protein
LKKLKKSDYTLLTLFLRFAQAQDDIENDEYYSDFLKVAIVVGPTAGCIFMSGGTIGAICGISGAGLIGGTISIHEKKLLLYKFFSGDVALTCSKSMKIFESGDLKMIIEKSEKKSIRLENSVDKSLLVLDRLSIKEKLSVAYDSLMKFADSCNSTEDKERLVQQVKRKNFSFSRRSKEIDELKIEMMPQASLEPMSGPLTKPVPAFEGLSKPAGR